MADEKNPPSTDARRELDRYHTGQATNADNSDVENELDAETRRLQRKYDSDAPKDRH